MPTNSYIPQLRLNEVQSIQLQPYLNVFKPKENNYQLGAQSAKTAEDRKYKAADASAAMDLVFNNVGKQLHQDAETASWFEDFKNKYKGEADNYLLSGDYGNAIFYAKQAAAKAAQDPELLARIKSNSEYQTQKNAVDNLYASGRIGQVTRDRWLNQNEYHFDAIRNDAGEVIGGKGFTADWMPVEQQNLSDFYEELQKTVTRQQGQNTSIVFLDANGNETTNPKDGVWGMAYKKGTSYEILGQKELKAAFDELLDTKPKLKAYLMQEHNDKLWEFNKASDENKKAMYNSDIADDQGNLYSFDDYISKKAGADLYHYRVNNIRTSLDYGTAYQNYRNASADKKEAQLYLDTPQGKGMIFEVDYSKDMRDSYAGALDALNVIDEYYNNPSSKNYSKTKSFLNDRRFINAKNNGDFVAMADYLSTHLVNTPKVRDAIRVMRHEGEIINALGSNLSKKDKNTINTYVALQLGTDILNPTDNNYATKIAKAKNNLFSYKKNGKNVPSNSFGLMFSNKQELDNFLQDIKISEDKLIDYGLTIRTENGLALEIDKRTPILKQIADANEKYGKNIVHWDNGIMVRDTSLQNKVNYNNALISNLGYTKPYNTNSEIARVLSGQQIQPKNNYDSYLRALSENGIAKEMKEDIDKIFNNKITARASTPSLPFTDFNVRTVMESVGMPGGFTLTEANNAKDFLDEANKSVLIESLSQAGNSYVIYEQDKNDVMRPVSEDDNVKIRKSIISANAGKRMQIWASLAPTPSGFGTKVVIDPIIDKNGKTTVQGKVYYIDGALRSDSQRLALRSKENRYLDKFRKLSSGNVSQKDIFGNNINYSSENAYNSFAAAQTLNTALEVVHDYAIDNKEISETEFDNITNNILNEHGMNINDSNYAIAKEIIKSKLINKYNKSLK